MKLDASSVPILGYGPLLLAVALLVLALTAAVAALPLLIPPKAKKETLGRHSEELKTSEWINRVEEVKKSYGNGEIGEGEAYVKLAALARNFASEELDFDLSTKTLFDLGCGAKAGNKRKYDMLRQTIAALYPPEFADLNSNRAANEADVESAANWVEDLISRWN